MKYTNWIKYSKFILNNYNKNINISEDILSFIIKKTKKYIFLNNNYFLKKEKILKLKIILSNIISGIPISYYIKEKEFWSMKFKVNKFVFIPRKETELIINIILNNIYYKNKKYKILDLGSGSGVISITLSNEIKNSFIIGTDINKEALKLSILNSNNLSKSNNLNFIYSNLFSNIKNKFDIIVSNPPYVLQEEFFNKNNEIIFDPIDSILNNNLNLFIKIIKYSKNFIEDNGFLVLEHGKFQGKFIRKIFKTYKYKNISTLLDYNNFERFTIGFLI